MMIRKCRIRLRWLVILSGLFLLSVTPARAQAPAIEKIPILLDTDAGSDVDDAFALALILASPELDLRGIATCGSDPQTRALLLCRFLLRYRVLLLLRLDLTHFTLSRLVTLSRLSGKRSDFSVALLRSLLAHLCAGGHGGNSVRLRRRNRLADVLDL